MIGDRIGAPSDNDDPALEPVRKAFDYVRLAAEQLLLAAVRLEVPTDDIDA